MATKHQSTDRYTLADIAQRWIAALVRLEVCPTKINVIISIVIVCRKVSKTHIPTTNDLAMNKGWMECAVTEFTSHVITPELGALYTLDSQAQRGTPVCYAGKEHGTMLIVIAGKKMRHEPIMIARGNQNVTEGFGGHGNFSK